MVSRLWRSRAGRKRLRSKAFQRWRSSEAKVVELFRARSQVSQAED